MVCKTLFALCIFTAGLRVQSLPTSAPLPVSLPLKVTPPLTIWTASPQNSSAVTAPQASSPHGNSDLPVTASVPTSTLPKNISSEPREEAVTSTASKWEGTTPDSSPPELSTPSSGNHSLPVSEGPSWGTPQTSVLTTESRSSAESSAASSPHTPASSPASPSTSPPEIPPASVTVDHSSTVTIPQPTGAPTTPESPTEEHGSGHAPTPQPTAEPVPQEGTPQETESGMVMCEFETTTPFVIMREVEHALSSGSIAAITVTVIAVVLLVFGVAAYLKIRHSSYGRLLDDHDYGSWGNYNNPLYDDS
ncbi:prostate androgen-regulated mucin-like protein 1 [Lepus europaeus]|uniref:prostate androgen-regulated mucin-like protein 1 n=1 Tax=Lepus europaeus TaxID=9983 RepID=UPI002B45C070|nr:prostate androgen-regulated mucin-like protein 1 [Lepus europaeus]